VSVWEGRAPRIGEHASRSRLITRRDIELFSDISGDENPLYRDDVIAEKAGLGGAIVPGAVSSSVINAVISEELPGPGTVLLALDLRFLGPSRPGQVLTGTVVVREVREDQPMTTLAVEVVRDDGVKVIEGTALTYTLPLSGPPLFDPVSIV
jgi:acyl dehydratase